MFLFSAPLYELLVREIIEACSEEGVRSERAVESDWDGCELLFRFTAERKKGRVGLVCCRLDSWCDGVRVSNDFDAERLGRMLR